MSFLIHNNIFVQNLILILNSASVVESSYTEMERSLNLRIKMLIQLLNWHVLSYVTLTADLLKLAFMTYLSHK